ncbi:MAG: molybdopterin-binding protein, partial [Caldilineaceae bacterium]
NDYSVQIPVAEVYALPVLIATRADGQRMTIEHYGPLRIVYPFGLLPLQQAVHEPRSIWQLFHLRVE